MQNHRFGWGFSWYSYTHRSYFQDLSKMHSHRWWRILLFYLLRSSRFPPPNPMSNDTLKKTAHRNYEDIPHLKVHVKPYSKDNIKHTQGCWINIVHCAFWGV